MTWDPSLVAEYRRTFISPACAECEDPCCVFGERKSTGNRFSMPLSYEDLLAVCSAGMAARWPLAHEPALLLLRHRIPEIKAGPCPAFVNGICLIYEDQGRPACCDGWPMTDSRARWPAANTPSIDCNIDCREMDRRFRSDHIQNWFRERAGVELEWTADGWWIRYSEVTE